MQCFTADDKMTEAEVSLRVALYLINRKLAINKVSVSIDGAQIKTGNAVHFEIADFLKDIGLEKTNGEMGKWQGIYRLAEPTCNIEIHSQPGVGDVVAQMHDGSFLVVESKKGSLSKSKSSSEYALMREAIGQLMTNPNLGTNKKLAVAVPLNEKSLELANRWSTYPQIKQVGISFLLVNRTGELIIIT